MNDKKPSRLVRWLKRIAFTLAVLITLVAVVVIFENWRGNRAWRNYLAEQEAKDEVLDWRKLVPPPVPDDQNFAKTPLLAKLTDYTYDPRTGKVVFADPAGYARLNGIFAWQNLNVIKGKGAWRKATQTDWPALQASLRALTNSELPAAKALLARPAGKPVNDVLFLIAQNKAELDEIAAVGRLPHANFGVHYEEGIMALLPQLSVIKNFAVAIQLRSLAELEAGQLELALADWQMVLALGETLKADPLLITLLVRIAVQDISHQVIWEGLSQRKWTDAQLQTIEERLAGINLVAEALSALRGERAFGMLALDQMHLRSANGLPRPGDIGIPSLPLLPSGWVSQNKLTIARMYDRFIFGAFDPAKQRVDIKLARQYEREVEATLGKFGPYTLMARMLFPAISKAGIKVASTQTALHLARVACALERHRLADGKYPADLSALVPRFLPKLPVDLDEQPLRYQLEANGQFTLYSIGSDLVDDQGRIGKSSPRVTVDEGDWVWKYPAP